MDVSISEQDLYYVYSSMKRLKELLEGVGSNGATMTNVNKTKFGNIEVYIMDKLGAYQVWRSGNAKWIWTAQTRGEAN